MSDEMKLLMAFIEASGFIVEESITYKEVLINTSASVIKNEPVDYSKYNLKTNSDGSYTIVNGMQVATFKTPTINYRVIKK